MQGAGDMSTEFTTHLGCVVTLYDIELGSPQDYLGPGKMLSLRVDGRYAEVHLSPEDLAALFREAKEQAWAEGLKKGWEATSDRVHYDMATGYRDLPKHLKKTNPYKEKS